MVQLRHLVGIGRYDFSHDEHYTDSSPPWYVDMPSIHLLPFQHLISYTAFTILRGFALLQNHPRSGRLFVMCILVVLALGPIIYDTVSHDPGHREQCLDTHPP